MNSPTSTISQPLSWASSCMAKRMELISVSIRLERLAFFIRLRGWRSAIRMASSPSASGGSSGFCAFFKSS